MNGSPAMTGCVFRGMRSGSGGGQDTFGSEMKSQYGKEKKKEFIFPERLC